MRSLVDFMTVLLGGSRRPGAIRVVSERQSQRWSARMVRQRFPAKEGIGAVDIPQQMQRALASAAVGASVDRLSSDGMARLLPATGGPDPVAVSQVVVADEPAPVGFLCHVRAKSNGSASARNGPGIPLADRRLMTRGRSSFERFEAEKAGKWH
jgi:hypothetical protein